MNKLLLGVIILMIISPNYSFGADGEILFRNKCSACHWTDYSLGRAETQARWRNIVSEMQDEKAGWISDAEGDKIAEYLSTRK